MATGTLGGGGIGAYQFIPPSETATVAAKTATLDAAAEAWSADAAQAPIPAPSSNLLASLPLGGSAADARPAPEASASEAVAPPSRYASSEFSLPLAPQSEVIDEPITRGQNPSNEYDDAAGGLDEELLAQAPPSPINPLRSAPQSLSSGAAPAKAAFDSAQQVAPAAAVAAFGVAASHDQQVRTVAAVEPIDAPLGDTPPTPLEMAPLGDEPSSDVPGVPAPFTPESNVGLPPMPGSDAPNPLRGIPIADEAPLPIHSPPAAMNASEQPAAAPTSDKTRSVLPPSQQPSSSPEFGAAAIGPTTNGSGRPGEQALEGPQQPSLVIQKFAPAEIQVGKPCKFMIKVRNVGQRPAMDVFVRDEAPAGVRLMTTTPQAEASGSQLTWALGVLSPGEERLLELELTPVEEGTIGSVATVSFAASASVSTKCTKPQLAIRMTAPSQVLVGQQQQIQIEIKNPGTGDATGVVIMENVPENLRHSAGPTLEFEVGTLRAGETRQMQLNMVAEKPGMVVNVLTAQADGNLQVDQKVEFEVVAPELEVAVDGPKRRYLERPATYTVKIGNPGTAVARDVRLVTRLPQGMKFVKANNMGEYDAATHAVYWSLAELPSGESGVVELTAMPIAAGEQKLQVQSEAQNGLHHETVYDTQVEGLAALKFTVHDLEDPIEVGSETEYEVRVANQGTKSAGNVRIQVSAPAGMRVISATGDARHRIEGGAVLFEPIGQLPPQSEMSFRVRVQGVQPGDHRLVVEVSSDDLGQPVRKEESTRVFGDE
jgi:uncharacterized repeat protein (TIGR01451 family)